MKFKLCTVAFFLFTYHIGLSQSFPEIQPVIQYATAYITQPSGTGQPTIRVVYETGESEVILLEKYSSREERKAGGKKISATDLDNQIKLTAFINDLAKKNYTLKEIEYEVSSHNSKYTILVFEKVVMITE